MHLVRVDKGKSESIRTVDNAQSRIGEITERKLHRFNLPIHFLYKKIIIINNGEVTKYGGGAPCRGGIDACVELTRTNDRRNTQVRPQNPPSALTTGIHRIH